jgi:hypothetical protein
VVASLPFIALLIGIFCAAAINIYNNKYYFQKFKANNNRPVPEARLPPMMLGGFVFTAGLFIFACEQNKQITAYGVEFLLMGFNRDIFTAN